MSERKNSKARKSSNRLLIEKLYYMFALISKSKWEVQFIARLHDLRSEAYVLSQDEERALHSILHKYRAHEALQNKDGHPLHVCDERCAAYETEEKENVLMVPLFDVTLFRGEGSYMTKETSVQLKAVE